MAINISTDLQLIHNCDDTTGWTSASSYFGVNVDAFLQGTACLGDVIGTATRGDLSELAVYDILGTTGSTVDATGKAFYVWMMSTLKIESIVNGGFRFYVEDINGNYGLYYIAGYENYFGGWQCFVIDPSQPYNEGVGTIDITQIAKVGVQWYTAVPKTGSAMNCYVDAIYLGTGVTVTVDDPTVDIVTFEDIFKICDDINNKWGVITKSGGVYFVRGSINFGDSINHCKFLDKSQVIVFDDNAIVGDDFYKLIVNGSDTATVDVQFGDFVSTASGNVGISGIVIKSSSKLVTIDFDSTNANISIYGSTFIGMGNIYLNGIVRNCLFSKCKEIFPTTICEFINNIISSSDDEVGALRIPLNNNISSCQFFGNNIAVELNEAGIYTFDNLYFSGNNYDINNTSETEVTVNIVNGGNASTYTGSSVIINNVVTLTLTGLKIGSEVRIYDANTMEELAGVESVDSDTFQYQYNYTGDKDVIIVVFNTFYEPIRINYTLTENDSILPIQQIYDRNYNNP